MCVHVWWYTELELGHMFPRLIAKASQPTSQPTSQSLISQRRWVEVFESASGSIRMKWQSIRLFNIVYSIFYECIKNVEGTTGWVRFMRACQAKTREVVYNSAGIPQNVGIPLNVARLSQVQPGLGTWLGAGTVWFAPGSPGSSLGWDRKRGVWNWESIVSPLQTLACTLSCLDYAPGSPGSSLGWNRERGVCISQCWLSPPLVQRWPGFNLFVKNLSAGSPQEFVKRDDDERQHQYVSVETNRETRWQLYLNEMRNYPRNTDRGYGNHFICKRKDCHPNTVYIHRHCTMLQLKLACLH